MLDFDRYSQEIFEFVNADTLEKIDWGILDLGCVRNYELREILISVERDLTEELKRNYEDNCTGIFRVSRCREFWCYDEGGYVIRAQSLFELKKIVEAQNRIWYVFDESLVDALR